MRVPAIERDARIKHAVVAQDRILTQEAAGADRGARADPGSIADHHVGTNLDLVFEQHVVSHLGGGMDSRPSRREREEKLHGPRQSYSEGCGPE